MSEFEIIIATDTVDEPAFFYADGHQDVERFLAQIGSMGLSVNTMNTFGTELEQLRAMHAYLRRIPCQGGTFMYDVRSDPSPGYRAVTVVSA